MVPLPDGNGRIGRMWHSLLLGKWKGRSTDQDSGQVTDQDKSPIKRLLSALGDDMLSAAEIMERLGLSHRPAFRKNYPNPALEQNLTERTIPDKPETCLFIITCPATWPFVML